MPFGEQALPVSAVDPAAVVIATLFFSWAIP
jgi:hypothetical protein